MNIKKYNIEKYIKLLKEKKLFLESNISDKENNKIIEYLTYNSKKAHEGTMFVCKGNNFKEQYLNEAINNNILVYVSEIKYVEDKPYIIVSDVRKALAVLSALYTNYPEKNINMIGITGTKGKSTTSYYIKYILDDYMMELNKPETAIISSIDTYDGKERKESVLTTPESLELHEHLRNAVDSKIENIVMEVCSQALKVDRVYDILYKIGVFLNISEDHISNIEHKDYEEYISAKLKLFNQTETAIINLNTQDSERVLKAAEKCKKIITFGNSDKADIYAYNIRKKGVNTIFKVKTNTFDKEFILTMPGLFNVENALAAIAVALELGVPTDNIYNGLKKAKASGRMEVYTNKNKEIVVIVDYAHNKLSFEKLYESTMKEYPHREIITVFGCPGNHAQNRRKDLGELSGKYSSMNYLTMEDPRNERTEDICKEISFFIEKENGKYKIVPDRGEAIKQAIFEAKPNSVILITGKGNETVQYINGEYIECKTDVEYTKEYLKEIDKNLKRKNKNKIKIK